MENKSIITKNNATFFPQNVQISAIPKQRSFTKQERMCVCVCACAGHLSQHRTFVLSSLTKKYSSQSINGHSTILKHIYLLKYHLHVLAENKTKAIELDKVLQLN